MLALAEQLPHLEVILRIRSSLYLSLVCWLSSPVRVGNIFLAWRCRLSSQAWRSFLWTCGDRHGNGDRIRTTSSDTLVVVRLVSVFLNLTIAERPILSPGRISGTWTLLFWRTIQSLCFLTKRWAVQKDAQNGRLTRTNPLGKTAIRIFLMARRLAMTTGPMPVMLIIFLGIWPRWWRYFDGLNLPDHRWD